MCYEYFVDADAVHVDDLEVETVPAELLPRGGNVFQLVENQSADRIVGIAGNGVLRAEEGQEIVKRTLPVEAHAAVLAPYDVEYPEAVGDLADKRLEDVLQGDDAARYAEFVAHDAVAELLAAQLFQRAVYLGSLVEELGGRKVVADVESGVVDMSELVFYVDDDLDFVEDL